MTQSRHSCFWLFLIRVLKHIDVLCLVTQLNYQRVVCVLKKSLVRCWKIKSRAKISDNDYVLYITYPEGHLGHELITCLVCGHIYSAIVEAELYIEVIKKRVRNLKCVECDSVVGRKLRSLSRNSFA